MEECSSRGNGILCWLCDESDDPVNQLTSLLTNLSFAPKRFTQRDDTSGECSPDISVNTHQTYRNQAAFWMIT